MTAHTLVPDRRAIGTDRGTHGDPVASTAGLDAVASLSSVAAEAACEWVDWLLVAISIPVELLVQG